MRNFTLFTLLLVFSFCSTISSAQTSINQSLSSGNQSCMLRVAPSAYSNFQIDNINGIPLSVQNNRILDSEAFKMLSVPVALSLTSFVTIPFKSNFQNIRNTYSPDFHNSYDDYTQYLPAGVMFGLKAFGVESQSSWGRMLTADAFSIATVLTLVNSLKYTINIKRPDSNARNSYPSGHTATAFMTATMLHKEYGAVNRWYSIGAYSVATLTGVTRVLNNRHWLSDVFFGAAIGIISTELGYLFTDLIFKDKGLNDIDKLEHVRFGENFRPSFLSLYTAIGVLPGTYKGDDGVDINLENSSRVGLEGAWYMNKYVGFGGLATVSTVDIEGDSGSTMGMASGLVGGYFSYPLSDRWRVGTKALVGVNFVKQPENRGISIPDYGTTLATGGYLSFLTSSGFEFKAFTDYMRHLNLINGSGVNEFNFGISMGFMFCGAEY